MALIDGDQALHSVNATLYDVVVVGAGAVGVMLGVLLGRRRLRPLLIETGGFREDPQRQALNEIEQVGKRLSDAAWTRKRVLGGTTTAWGGQSLPFSPSDFAVRSWVDHSGWPIPFAEIAQHYQAANAFMGVTDDGDEAVLSRFKGARPPCLGRDLVHHLSRWAPEPNFFKLHRRELELRADVLFNTHVTDLAFSDDGRVCGLHLASFSGGTRRLDGVNCVVLATGGIETTRQLLIARRRCGDLGGSGDAIGRYFMEHPSISAAVSDHPADRVVQRIFGTHARRRIRYSKRLSASSEWQSRTRLLNISSTFIFEPPGGGDSPLTKLRKLQHKPSFSAAGAVVLALPNICSGLAALGREGLVYKPGCRIHFALMCEQPPQRDSRITLSETLDRFGLPIAKLDWRLAPSVAATIRAFTAALRGDLARLGLADLRPAEPLNEDDDALLAATSDVNHHMGGARMSDDHADGVVSTDLRVYGATNLYVCSAAVFPTSSHSNPTLTLLALAARLVDRLAADAKPGVISPHRRVHSDC